jgi:hypothetical protein
MIVVLALVCSLVFGAVDQYLGSLTGSGHAWAAGWSTDLSLLSAPWLLLPFLAGATQREPRRAALVGLACTYAALLAYGLMTVSPLEHAHLSLATARGFVVSERGVLIGGVVTGPLFGWFGERWRARRSLPGLLALALCFCLEPLARRASMSPIRVRDVWIAEVTAGLVLVAYAARSRAHAGARGS